VIIEITPKEAMAIDLLCRNEDLSPKLFLQIGQIILRGEPMKVSVSEQDLWRIREAVPYAQMIDKEPVGLTLKCKVYECLLNMDLEREIGIPVGSTEEPRFDKEGLTGSGSPNHDSLNRGGGQ
jgi:hypothetical protein